MRDNDGLRELDGVPDDDLDADGDSDDDFDADGEPVLVCEPLGDAVALTLPVPDDEPLGDAVPLALPLALPLGVCDGDAVTVGDPEGEAASAVARALTNRAQTTNTTSGAREVRSILASIAGAWADRRYTVRGSCETPRLQLGRSTIVSPLKVSQLSVP